MPLSLRTYFFPRILIQANDSYSRNSDGYDETKCTFSGNVEFSDGSSLMGNFLFDLSPDGDESIPYEIEIHAFAAFELHEDLAAREAPYIELFDRQVDSLKRSAIGMVYGALRELVASTSGRQPWGPFLIPTIIPDEIDVDVVLSEDLEAFRRSLKSVHEERKAPRKVSLKRPGAPTTKKLVR